MRVFSEAAVLEKNRLASDSPFLIFLEIENKEIGVIRLVRNTENIMWQGNEWQAFPLDIETSSEDGKTIPALNVKVSNCGGIIQTYLQQHNGLADSMVRLMVALASNLENPNPEFELDFLIKSASYDESWVTFCLSASAELMNRFPTHRYINNFCPFRCGDLRCGYIGAGVCVNTLETCLIPSRFGGEPGIQRGR